MDFYFSKKRKLRGWKRRKKEIEHWKEKAFELDIDCVRENHKDYVKLWINPFYGLIRMNPPIWYRRLLLKAMVEVYLNWHKKMKEEGEPFYLKLWLNDTEFIDSQVVVAYKTEKEYYEGVFDKQGVEKEFPYKKYETVKELIDMFEWELCFDDAHYSKSDLEELVRDGFMNEKEVEDIVKTARKEEELKYQDETKDTLYSVNVGDVWVGTLKGEIEI